MPLYGTTGAGLCTSHGTGLWQNSVSCNATSNSATMQQTLRNNVAISSAPVNTFIHSFQRGSRLACLCRKSACLFLGIRRHTMTGCKSKHNLESHFNMYSEIVFKGLWLRVHRNDTHRSPEPHSAEVPSLVVSLKAPSWEAGLSESAGSMALTMTIHDSYHGFFLHETHEETATAEIFSSLVEASMCFRLNIEILSSDLALPQTLHGSSGKLVDRTPC